MMWMQTLKQFMAEYIGFTVAIIIALIWDTVVIVLTLVRG